MNTLEREEAMKFIINGRTFDTATSTKAAISRGINPPDYNNIVGDSEVRFENVLYRTAKGAFFVHTHASEKLVKGGKPIITDEAESMTAEQAVEWITRNGAAVLDDAGLPMPAEPDSDELVQIMSPELDAIHERIATAVGKALGLNPNVPTQRERIEVSVGEVIENWEEREVDGAKPATELEKLLQEYVELAGVLIDEDYAERRRRG